MTHTLFLDIVNDQGLKDQYVVYLTRDPSYVARNEIDDREIAALEGEWCTKDATYDPSFLARLSSYISSTDLSIYKDPPANGTTADIKSMWNDHVARHTPLLDCLLAGDTQKSYGILNRMYQSSVMHGITQGDVEVQLMNAYPDIMELRLRRAWDILMGVSEYIGIIPPQNHEQGASYLVVPVDVMVNELGYLPNFRAPPWQGGQWCLKTSKGLFSDRDLIALYLAIKIREKFPDPRTRIVEIGGGSGYLAYWLYLFGYRDITMVDLPTVMCCQAFQLRSNHPGISISMPNDDRPAEVKFLDTKQFQTGNNHYDLVINCDSLPEMSLETVHAYLDAIARQAQFFYSINQESRAQGGYGRQHSIRYEIKQHFRNRLMRADRSRFWLRDGYTEEWYGAVR